MYYIIIYQIMYIHSMPCSTLRGGGSNVIKCQFTLTFKRVLDTVGIPFFTILIFQNSGKCRWYSIYGVVFSWNFCRKQMCSCTRDRLEEQNMPSAPGTQRCSRNGSFGSNPVFGTFHASSSGILAMMRWWILRRCMGLPPIFNDAYSRGGDR